MAMRKTTAGLPPASQTLREIRSVSRGLPQTEKPFKGSMSQKSSGTSGLEHRFPNRKTWVRCPMPPNTFRVHTEYVLVKSVGPKVLWVES
ncbi:hypothetical protein TNCV_1176131 [Trichonephila clavipes]|nr:hypothetical protein TNCV_1176131 [Trichonephila clavipes]